MNRKIYIANDIVSLVEYKPCDDYILYEDWLDPETQKGYNCVYVTTFEDYQAEEATQRFFAMIQLNETNKIIGAVGISPPECEPDLSIQIFKSYRKKGYGTSAFGLATKYAVDVLKIDELHAGAYPDNIGSRKMIKRCGYIPNSDGNVPEKHYITDEDIIQLDFIYGHVTVRSAVPSDASDMAEVIMRSWEVAYKDIIPADYIREKNATRPAMWRKSLSERQYPHMVIQLNGKTVGNMCVASPQDDDLGDDYYELHGIYLHPDYYRQGIGTKAMGYAFDIARNFGKKFITVWVFAENINSIKFYEKCGFVADSKIKTLNCGKLLTAIRMRRKL